MDAPFSSWKKLKPVLSWFWEMLSWGMWERFESNWEWESFPLTSRRTLLGELRIGTLIA